MLLQTFSGCYFDLAACTHRGFNIEHKHKQKGEGNEIRITELLDDFFPAHFRNYYILVEACVVGRTGR